MWTAPYYKNFYKAIAWGFVKGSFTYYVITKGEGGGIRNDYANVIFALSNAEFDYGRGEGVYRNSQKVIT